MSCNAARRSRAKRDDTRERRACDHRVAHVAYALRSLPADALPRALTSASVAAAALAGSESHADPSFDS
jgi:hypothetical protein